MIRVLIVEDSLVEQQLLAHILSTDPRITVVGIANDGEMALSSLERLKPDVITMDIHMPKLNGFDTTRRIMESNPLPIIIVSGSYNVLDTDKSFRAIEAGALAILRKPIGPGHPDYQSDAAELIRTVKTMSEIKVVKRWPQLRKAVPVPPLPIIAARITPDKIRVVAIGASTGGPAIIQEILSALPKNLSAPLLVVQHMASGFMDNFVKWLCATTGFPSHIAVNGEYPAPGHAYFAPDGLHMLVGRDHRIILTGEEPENGLRPSVSRLFRSVAETFGSNAMGVLLTGMGRDGAADLKLMRDKGAVTVVQNEESSIIFGMPGEAVRLGAAEYILPPEQIAGLLEQLVKR
ncbi:MAG: chemotaxis-specific protein-glutamate methyltransferase CheB [Desulfuromonadaceae bacterium]|nr:chemotaxis-specific protein-glutamate methyltransferase CheB [Desulfuromonadaceae bacterium]MDD5105235.1 chemotaxis-specific protein-glutamate methyltransferase CheB [Desulfuromonadaceae bacterium]